MFREKEKNIETQTKSKQSTWTKTLKYKHWNLEEHKQSKVSLRREREKTWSPGQRSDSEIGVSAGIECVGVCLFLAGTPSSSRFVLG